MLNQPKIMVVDDDDGLRITLADILEDEGFDVTSVNDGLQGVEMPSSHHYGLIFMDVRMPGIDGVEAYRLMEVVSSATIVIMVTAYSGGLVEDALTEGAYTVLYKPFGLEHLTGVVRTVLKSTCVLVVDDQPYTRALMRDILESNGYQVSEAEDGMQAVNKAGKKRYDVILTPY